ncbi:MAG: hypothetical protein QXD13_02310 [Candidatus Pacearchaeota archaeon]
MPQFEVINNEVFLDKEITKLDLFVLDVLQVLEKFTSYVIISGYVSIFFGRARATEDVDIFIDDIPYESFKQMYDSLIAAGYEFTIDNPLALFKEYLKNSTPVSVWRKDFPLLRIEMKIASKPSQKLVLKERIAVKFKDKTLYFAPIESQIAYKRFVAKSDKDLEDARHLEIVFKNLDKDRIERFKNLFLQEFKHG